MSGTGQTAILTAIDGPAETLVVSLISTSSSSLTVSRRCADVAELLATAAAGRGQVALVGATMPRLDRDVIATLRGHGVAVVGVVDAGGGPVADQGLARLRSLGVTVHLSVGPATTVAEVERCVLAAARTVESGHGAGILAAPTVHVVPARTVDVLSVTPRPSAPAAAPPPGLDDEDFWDPADVENSLSALDPESAEPSASASPAGGEPGKIVAVWGPTGAPGRTTVAVNLAAELAARGRHTLLVDADTYGASIAQHLGILDEAPGVAAACRSASAGTLDATMLARLAPQTSPRLHVLTGIGRADRWLELTPAGLEQVWTVSRQLAHWTVVDTGFCLERDEELTYDTFAPQRNGATLAALDAADEVVVVGTGDPVGMARLIKGLSQLQDLLPGITPRVVVTKVRSAASGTDPAGQIHQALQRHVGVTALIVPDDRAAVDGALLAGATLAEHAARSAVRQAIRALSIELSPVLGAPSRQGATRRRRPALFRMARLAAS